MRSGAYEVGEPLLVRDGVTLQGAGVMQPDQGLPDKFKQGTKTTIKAEPGLKGNLLTLSDGSAVRGLVLQGAPPPSPPGPVPEDHEGRGGNVVAVASGGKGVSVSATINECVLINKITSGGVTDGPMGGAILAYTRNPNRGNPPLPHEDAAVTVTVKRSIVDTPLGGKAVFAMNFASGGKVTIKLKQNKVGGPLDVIGGISRPDTVVFATTISTRRGISTRNRNQKAKPGK